MNKPPSEVARASFVSASDLVLTVGDLFDLNELLEDVDLIAWEWHTGGEFRALAVKIREALMRATQKVGP